MDFSDSDNDAGPVKWDKIHQMEMDKINKQHKDWGKNRDTYYNSDTQDFQVEKDEDTVRAEEAEIKLIQREQAEMMAKMDLGLDSLLATKKSKKDVAPKATNVKSKKGTKGAVLSIEERVRQVLALSPELLTLLSTYLTYSQELQDTLPQLISNLPQLKSHVDIGSIVSIVKLRQQLLMSYCSLILFYLYLKSMGKSTSNHPVIKQMLHLQTLLGSQDDQFNKIRDALLNVKLNILPYLPEIKQQTSKRKASSLATEQEDDVFALRRQRQADEAKAREQKAADKAKADKKKANRVDISSTIIDEEKRRRASKKILYNTGLRRQKSHKQLKHSVARGKLRQKHESAVTKRKSTVREYKGQQGSEYGGEATIKKGLIRSVKLG